MAARKAGGCISCGVKIEISDSAVSILLFCRTVGIEERLASKTERLYICTKCATRLAMGPKPSNGAINVSVWVIIRGLVAKHPGVVKAAWEELQDTLSHPAAELPEGEVLPPVARRVLSAAS